MPNEDVLLQCADISYAEILKLEEAMIINSDSNVRVVLHFEENNNEHCLIYNNKIIFCTKNSNSRVDLKAFTLTEVGRNIFDILLPVYNDKYFKKYIDFLKSMMNVSYSTILRKISGNKIEYQKPVIDVK